MERKKRSKDIWLHFYNYFLVISKTLPPGQDDCLTLRQEVDNLQVAEPEPETTSCCNYRMFENPSNRLPAGLTNCLFPLRCPQCEVFRQWTVQCRQGPSCRPSKCPKFYTTMISSETNLRQKERKFCQNFNLDKLL